MTLTFLWSETMIENRFMFSLSRGFCWCFVSPFHTSASGLSHSQTHLHGLPYLSHTGGAPTWNLHLCVFVCLRVRMWWVTRGSQRETEYPVQQHRRAWRSNAVRRDILTLPNNTSESTSTPVACSPVLHHFGSPVSALAVWEIWAYKVVKRKRRATIGVSRKRKIRDGGIVHVPVHKYVLVNHFLCCWDFLSGLYMCVLLFFWKIIFTFKMNLLAFG